MNLEIRKAGKGAGLQGYTYCNMYSIDVAITIVLDLSIGGKKMGCFLGCGRDTGSKSLEITPKQGESSRFGVIFRVFGHF